MEQNDGAGWWLPSSFTLSTLTFCFSNAAVGCFFWLKKEEEEEMKCPLACWVTAVGSRACVPKLRLLRELLKAVGDMDSITPAALGLPFPRPPISPPLSRPAPAIPSMTTQIQPSCGL